MGAMMFLLMRAINTRLSVVLTTSAMRNAHQTIFTLPVRLSSHAIGISTTSWRQTEMMRLYTPLPNAWNTELSTMPMPASRKWGQMIRSAGMPMASMASLAAKRFSSRPGANWNTQKPMSMMHSA